MCKRFERMMKCLELTASTNDAEALAAMHQANRLREVLGLAWSDLAIKPAAFGNPKAEREYAELWRVFGSDSPESEREFAELRRRYPGRVRAMFPEWRTLFPEMADE